MEIGSFIELQFSKGMEYYPQQKNIARLNTGRAAIWHALRLLGGGTIWLPIYQCDTVRDFLHKKNVNIKYYHIDKNFNPTDLEPLENEIVLFVNYYGMMSAKRMESLVSGYKNVIIDNCQAFFAKPLKGCMNVYSCRKFIGVPDGAYVIGKDAEVHMDEYGQCYSSDTAVFMLQRVEYGCEGKAYQSRQLNEHRIDTEDIMRMSKLTKAILDGTDYELIQRKRIENFHIARELFDKINCLDVCQYCDRETVPMVYPLVVEEDNLLNRLQKAKHFQGHWWSYLLDEVEENYFEYWISRFFIPITIDQRYGEDELIYIKNTVGSTKK